MAFADAAATFTTLTVGDGLVSQIPALLVSTAAGIVVTKGGTEGSADAALMRQLGGNPKPLALAGSAAAVLALMPGLPALPFFALAGMAGAGAYLRHRYPAGGPALPPPRPTVPTEPPIDLVVQREHLAAAFQQEAAMRRERDCSALAAQQQALAELLLQALHLHGNRGLRASDAFGGAGEAAFLRDEGEGAQQVGVEALGDCHGHQGS